MMFTAQEISEATGFPTYEQMKEWCEANAEGRLLILPKTLYEADPTPLIMGVIEWKVTGVRYCDGTVRAYSVQTENVQVLAYGPTGRIANYTVSLEGFEDTDWIVSGGTEVINFDSLNKTFRYTVEYVEEDLPPEEEEEEEDEPQEEVEPQEQEE